jgi:DNA (cytosine-5)-methyltransferase 1
MTAYYNEFDPFAASRLRELIAAGHIAPGEVDERPIQKVDPDDLKGFCQVHLFGGVGGWSLAFRLAGIPDDYPAWSGSCPCQPYSHGGRNLGNADPRNLWPEMRRLVRERRPVTILGEQVDGAIAHGWLDGVFDDLEGMQYACGAHVLPACCVGAPQVRQRIWWVADLERERQPRPRARRDAVHPTPDPFGEAGGLLDAVREGTLPYVCGRHDGVSDGVGLMRGFGNAIVPQLAAEFITAYLELTEGATA